MRDKISQIKVDFLLFRSDHTCSICRQIGKDVQIHHIDGHNSNNNINNLIVLCLDCHSRVTGNAGLGRRFTKGELTRYKRSWEQTIMDKRRVKRPVVKYKKELVSQIDLLICEILAVKNIKRAQELFDLLFELHLYRGFSELDKKIIEGLQHLSLQAGLTSARLSELVADTIWMMCFHYVGPKEVPITKSGKDYVFSCMNALDTVGDYTSAYVRKRRATQAYCDNIWNFFEISIWYNWKALANKIIDSIENSLNSCSYGKKLEYPEGKKMIKRFIKKMIMTLTNERPTWRLQLKDLNNLL